MKNFVLAFAIIFIVGIFRISGQSLTGISIEKSGSTSSTTFVTVNGDAQVTLDVTNVEKVMVVGTFECSASGNATGSYRIADDADNNINSGEIQRSLNTYRGVGSVVYIFDVSSFSGNRTWDFQHLTDAGTINTAVQLSAIALYDGSNQLACEVQSLGSPVVLNSSWETAVESNAVLSSDVGGFYVSASIQSSKTSGTSTSIGEWVIQYRTVSGSWTDISYPVQRSTSGTGKGVINLVGALPDNTPSGNYYFRVAHRLVSGTDPVETQECKMIVVSLATSTGFFPVSVASKTDASTTNTSMSAVSESIIMPQVNTKIFLHAQYGLKSNGSSNAPKHDLYVNNSGTEEFNGMDLYRYLSNSSDRGSATVSGLTNSLMSGNTYQVSLRHASTSGRNLTTMSALLVGFGLTKGQSFKVPVTVNATEGLSSSSYSCLKDAFDDINLGIYRGEISIMINDNTIETASCVLNGSGIGNANYTSVTIFPTGHGLSISGNISSQVIYLNGADNVTIDGRENLMGNQKDLTIVNTSTASYSRTILLQNDATENIIRYCNVNGSQTSTGAGVIQFGVSTLSGTSLGNSNNVIEYCCFSYGGSSITSAPANMIYSYGSSGKTNKNNIVQFNEFVNFFSDGSSSNGVNIYYHSTDWTVRNNSFYYTEPFVADGNYTYTVININNISGGNYTVENNYIGGSEKECGGTAFTKTGRNTLFVGISFTVGSIDRSSVDGNVIQKINWTNTGSSSWRGISIEKGLVDVGTSCGNTIGDSLGTESIVVCNGSSGNSFYGIRINSTDPLSVNNNIIGAIKTTASDPNYAFHIYGIEKTPLAGDITISNNIVGSKSTQNSIWASSTCTNSYQYVYGIHCSGTETNIISNNIVAHLNNEVINSSNSSRVSGIITTKGNNTIINNTIDNISSASAQTGVYTTAAVIGINQVSTISGTSQIVKNNSVTNIMSTNATERIDIYGIMMSAPTSGTQVVSENFISGFSFSTSNISSDFDGIVLNVGATTCSNNVIALGGTSIGYGIYGIWDNGSTGNNCNIYFNTISIGGSVSSGASNTTAALYSRANTSTRDYRNNILVNSRTGGTVNSNYCIYLNGLTNQTINYNDYYFPSGSVLGKIGSSFKSDLSAWQSGTGQDANSLNIDPVFDNPSGNTAYDYEISTILNGDASTGILVDFDGISRQATPQMGAFEKNDYVWTGATNTDFATASNWLSGAVPPDGVDITFAANPSNHCILDQNRIIRNLINAQSVDQFILNGNTLTITGDLQFTNGAQIDASATSSVIAFAGNSSQSIPANAFVGNSIAGLSISNPSGVALNTNISINENFVLDTGALSIGNNILSINGAIVEAGGSLIGGSSSNIVFGGSGAATTLPTVILNNLTINRANGISMSGSTEILGTLSLTSGVFTLGANVLTISGNSPAVTSGSIDASNTSSEIIFDNDNAISLPSCIFSTAVNDLTISGGGGMTANSSLTINGVLNLQSNNPAADLGLFNLTSPYELTMGGNATTIGLGDFTGIVTRTTFMANKYYTFGNEFTTIAFASGGTYPTYIKCLITIGNAPSWKPEAIQRMYNFIQSGGVNCYANVATHYLDAELNGAAEYQLTQWTYSPPSSLIEWGRIDFNTTDNWVSINNVGIYNFPTVFGNLENTLSMSLEPNFTWNGQISTDWNDANNWTPTSVPTTTSAVVIPDASLTPNDPLLPPNLEIELLTIEAGGILNDNNSQFTINGADGAWNNAGGTFNAGTGNVIFTNANANISGITSFYNFSVNTGAILYVSPYSVIRIENLATNNGPWRPLVNGVKATIEYNGGDQTIVIPDSTANRFYNLILSGSGTKTMPGAALTINGNLEVKGTASVTCAASLTINGCLSIDSGAIFNTGNFDHVFKGDLENHGTFSTVATKTITLSGTTNQGIYGSSNISFKNLTINNPENVNMFTDINVDENLILTNGNLILAQNTLSINGGISRTSGHLSACSFCTLRCSGSSALTLDDNLFSANPVLFDFIIDRSGGVTIGSQDMTIENELVLNSGTLNISGKTFTLNGSISKTSGNLAVNNATNLIFNSSENDLTIPDNVFLGFPIIQNLTMNRGSSIILGNQAISIDGKLILVDGYIFTPGSGSIALTANATVGTDISNSTPGSTQSLVAGYVQKTGNTAFTFPVGNDSIFAPISISADASGSTADYFTAKYFNANPDPSYSVSSLDAALDHVSTCEYWTLERNGTNNVEVSLSWDDRSCGVSNLSNLVVAHWNSIDSKWESEGNSNTSGGIYNGTVTSNMVSDFSPFTLGSVSSENPLPVVFSTFTASCFGNGLLINWSTESETNSSYFLLERFSSEGDWVAIVRIEGAGNSNQTNRYSHYDDVNASESIHYRIKQVDFDGHYTYTNIISVLCNDLSSEELIIYPVPATTVINVISNFDNEMPEYSIQNSLGIVLKSGVIESSQCTIDIENMEPGMYILQIHASQPVEKCFVVE